MFCLIVVSLLLFKANSELINTKVTKVVNLESQLVKTTIFVTLVNLNEYRVNNYLFIAENYSNLAHICFKDAQENELKYIQTNLNYEEEQIDNAFRVIIKGGFCCNETVRLKVELVYLNEIIPMYKTRTFDQDLTLIYKGNYYYYSPYKTLEVYTRYILNNSTQVLKVTHTPSQQMNESFEYYSQDVSPFSFEEINIIFKNNIKFLIVTKLERNIDVSHFGSICVQENIDLTNQAGKLVGPYKSLKKPEWWYTFLPSSAVDIKYYDSLGYNFKIHTYNLENHVTVKFQPRFPLRSGWNTSYTLSYCLPIYEYLYHDFEDNFVLQMRAIDNVLEDFVAKDVLVNVILPEAAELINVNLPDGFLELSEKITYTSLVLYGRPTVVFNGSNLIENHINDFIVQYKFVTYYQYSSGSIICIYVYSIFLFIILIVHKSN